jgi:hypothetical protein
VGIDRAVKALRDHLGQIKYDLVSDWMRRVRTEDKTTTS